VRIKVLDLFCGAGGSAMGIFRAFKGKCIITGIDIREQPNYPFEFIRGDAVEFLKDTEFLKKFDFIWASPPCQAYSWASARWRNSGYKYPDIIGVTRDMLVKVGKPFVIENVKGAPLRKDLMLCGLMFGLRVFRHRYFEIHGFSVPQPPHPSHKGLIPYRDFFIVSGHHKGTLSEWREAMGIDWMTRDELREAIPPAYSEYILKHYARG